MLGCSASGGADKRNGAGRIVLQAMLMKYVLRLDEITMAHLALVGGKAARLGDLVHAGFPVPPGFCLTSAAFETCCRRDASSGRLEIAEIPPEISAEVIECYQSLGQPAVAVRSSSTAEDTEESSFAGQYESVLQVVGNEQVLLAIRRCWASLWSPRAIAYRERATPGGSAPTMAVIVQAMVHARASGVMFTANPVTSDISEIVITANPGLATVVVSGRVTPDTYRLDKATFKVRERDLAQKFEMAVADEEGTRIVAVPERLRRASTLTRRQCAELGRLGERIERHFGSPQDIEFVDDGERFCIVQSRPVTGLVSWGEPKKGILTRHSVLEFTPRPVSPLFEAIYLPLIGDFMRQLVREFGIVFHSNQPIFVTINGYAFMRGDLRDVRLSSLSVMQLLASPLACARYLADVWRHRWRRTELEPYARTVATWKDVDAERSPEATLWEGVIEICRANANYWRACMLNRVSGMIEQVFVRIYPLMVPEKKRVPASVFLRGHDTETARAEREFHLLAQDVRRDAELRSVFAERSAEGIEVTLGTSAGGREWLSRFREYVARNGYQISNLDFMEPTLGESPGPLFARLKLLVADDHSTSRFEQARGERLAAQAVLMASLGPFRRAFVSWMLALLDYGLVLREDVLFFFGLGWPVVRRFILELGARLVRNGFLDDRTDVFFLTRAEIDEMFGIEATVDPSQVRQTIAARRQRWKEHLRLKPPVLIVNVFPFLFSRMRRFWPEHRGVGGGNRICGVPASPGRVTASASVVGSVEEFDAMKAGAILVAPMTSPAWTPLLAMASGVVTDVGSMLSHASIVAREYGIPAVIGTGVASRRIASGQVVTVDGDEGSVTLGNVTPQP
jgi:pyruvate,water dikinase